MTEPERTAALDAEPDGSTGEDTDPADELHAGDSFPASDPPSSWWGGTGDPVRH